MAPLNSKRKGKVGEREWCHFLTEQGYPAKRGQQFKGTEDSPDVECPELSGVHFEVKRREKLNPYKFMAQAAAECGNKVPVVAMRSNQKEWLVVLRARDWVGLLPAEYSSPPPRDNREEFPLGSGGEGGS